jgi:hypothetical protein
MRQFAALPLLMLTTSAVLAADMEPIPTKETDFVDAIVSISQAQIAELLGDPAYTYTIRNSEGQPAGTIWHYHYVTTTDDGEYYKTTELDFIGDRVSTVVFINNDAADPSGVAASPCDVAMQDGC